MRCKIDNELMKVIGSLPVLQVLKLQICRYFDEFEWKTSDNELPWMTEDTDFPRLRRLVIRNCSRLKEIPSCIGDIPTLESIELFQASRSVINSARQIEEEQLDMGNDLLICITSPLF